MITPTWVPELIGWLFLVTNTGRLVAYFPQIFAAARCDAGARSVSLLTWGYFAVAHFTALLYAVFVLRDSRSIAIFCGNFVVTLVLVAIVARKRAALSHAVARNETPGTSAGKIRLLRATQEEQPGQQACRSRIRRQRIRLAPDRGCERNRRAV